MVLHRGPRSCGLQPCVRAALRGGAAWHTKQARRTSQPALPPHAQDCAQRGAILQDGQQDAQEGHSHLGEGVGQHGTRVQGGGGGAEEARWA